MPSRATISKITHSESGQVHVQYDDGNMFSGTLQDLENFVSEWDSTQNCAKAAALGQAFAQDPSLRNVNSVLGKAVVLNAMSNNPVSIDPSGGTGVTIRAERK
jgi:hypothetical protein